MKSSFEILPDILAGYLNAAARSLSSKKFWLQVVDLMELRSIADRELTRLERDARLMRTLYPRWMLLRANSLKMSGRQTAATALFNQVSTQYWFPMYLTTIYYNDSYAPRQSSFVSSFWLTCNHISVLKRRKLPSRTRYFRRSRYLLRLSEKYNLYLVKPTTPKQDQLKQLVSLYFLDCTAISFGIKKGLSTISASISAPAVLKMYFKAKVSLVFYLLISGIQWGLFIFD